MNMKVHVNCNFNSVIETERHLKVIYTTVW